MTLAATSRAIAWFTAFRNILQNPSSQIRFNPAAVEFLESRELYAFSNWTAISAAIAKVPLGIGPMTKTTVINFGKTIYSGPLDVTKTMTRIRANNGPNRSGDGAVFSNPTASGLPSDGTYYEFTVDPKTGTDRSFTTIAFPGPMRILLSTGGDCFFTGDHYSTFQALYLHGSATPIIGSLSANPSSVTIGGAVTLTAANVTETGGTISSVKFYRESNGTTGLQTASDTLLGTGAVSGANWTLSTTTSNLTAGNYTYYAVATDAKSVTSNPASSQLTVTTPITPNPVIGGFTVNPASVVTGSSTTLTASNVTDAASTINSVNFYRDSNGVAGLQTASDTLVGTGTQSGTTWTYSLATTGLAVGNYTFFVVASDAASVSSTPVSATLSITNPVSTSGAIAGWNVAGQTNYGTQGLLAATVVNGVTNSLGLTRASGVTTTNTAASNAWGGNGWAATSATGISANQYASFGLTVSAGTVVSLSSIDLHYRRSSTGPGNGLWQYQLNAGAWTTIADVASEFSSTTSTGANIAPLPLAGIPALQNLAAGTTVNLRVIPYAGSTGGTWYVYDQTGNDLIISGSTASAAPAAAPLVAAQSFAATFSSTRIATSLFGDSTANKYLSVLN